MTAAVATRAAVSAEESWALVQRVQAGDMDAYGELYRAHYEQVYRYVRFRVGNHELAEDIVSTAFVRALRGVDRFTWQGRAYGALLATIAHNLITDWYKSGRYRLEFVCDEPHGARVDSFTGRVERGGLLADNDPGPEVVAVDLEYLRQVRAPLLDALMELTPEQRQVLVLRFFNDMSVAETAEAMGKKEGAVKALQSRAVQSMRRFLPEGFEW